MFQEVMHQVISVASDPQLCGSESVYLVSGMDVQQEGVTFIKKDYVDVTEQDESTRFMCVLYLHAKMTTV
jgi:hypothetical protein